MKKILLLFLVISSATFGQKKLDKLLNKWNQRNIPYMSVETLAMPKTNAILLDAREEKEFKVSHLQDAISVGYNDFKIEETLRKLPKDKATKIVVYCSLGIRSETIAYKIMQEGYTNVYNLYGGIFEWKNADFQVIDTLGKSTEKVHAFNKNWGKWLKKGEKVY
ncbi:MULTISPECIES: rhodanese-like domain-containing protein [unclassified Polaribacter]|uniref:rhodanese-like domain-containing protein n=1 Tax=unclassified Polaribacter TaxID=196858 RepID=UPI0011BDA144|nr:MULTISPECIES: rhodanese-like domain-containing protein [unclassified Polaribacter]TXD54045.1 rhodanese-like domain-containing protein [Polaribacter sp. IC063]TXD62561.1 rhodanese-like domain-containing protein [Polaribacter sp. IC066]